MISLVILLHTPDLLKTSRQLFGVILSRRILLALRMQRLDDAPSLTPERTPGVLRRVLRKEQRSSLLFLFVPGLGDPNRTRVPSKNLFTWSRLSASPFRPRCDSMKSTSPPISLPNSGPTVKLLLLTCRIRRRTIAPVRTLKCLGLQNRFKNWL